MNNAGGSMRALQTAFPVKIPGDIFRGYLSVRDVLVCNTHKSVCLEVSTDSQLVHCWHGLLIGGIHWEFSVNTSECSMHRFGLLTLPPGTACV